MKKILVPIDNTKVSKQAALYAVSLAESLRGEIILLSVINAIKTPSTLINWRILEQQMVARVQEEALNMIREIKDATGTRLKIVHKYILGFPVHEAINRFVKDNSIELVVMGTGGARGLKKVLTGSHTASVIDSCSVPVVTVPKATTAKGIKKIVYATDMLHLDDEIKTIAGFAKSFDADIEIVHLTANRQRNRDRSEFENILMRMAKYRKIHLTVTKGADVGKGLRALASKHKADLIVMFTHELNFFEKLIGKGFTRQVAFDSSIPLLAFNRTNAHL